MFLLLLLFYDFCVLVWVREEGGTHVLFVLLMPEYTLLMMEILISRSHDWAVVVNKTLIMPNNSACASF